MSDSSLPVAQPTSPAKQGEGPHQATKQTEPSNATLYVRRAGVSALLVGAAVACFFLEVAEASAVLTAVATVILALFTWALSDATAQIRESADATATQQFRLMEQQRVVMTAQQEAMETQAAAMEEQVVAMSGVATAVLKNAEAAKEAADLIREQVNTLKWMRVAQFPPALGLDDITIDMDEDGVVIVHYTVVNHGESDARITATHMLDACGTRSGGRFKPGIAARNAPELVDKIIKPRHGLPGSHQCTGIEPTAYLEVTQGHDPDTDLFFGGWIRFQDENGVDRTFQFNRPYVAMIGAFSNIDHTR